MKNPIKRRDSYMAERRRESGQQSVREEIRAREPQLRSGKKLVSSGRMSGPTAEVWKLEDAKAHFSEVVRRARTEGPQVVTRRGKDAVVVIAMEELERLTTPTHPKLPFLAFMESLHVPGLDLDIARERDTGREVDL